MRTHEDIIRTATAPAIAQITGADPNTVHAWKRENSIPGAHWRSIVLAGHASYEELAQAAERRAEQRARERAAKRRARKITERSAVA